MDLQCLIAHPVAHLEHNICQGVNVSASWSLLEFCRKAGLGSITSEFLENFTVTSARFR